MSEALTLRSHHFSTENEYSDWTREEVGLKAVGLIHLPITWTPQFIVITNTAFNRWKESFSREELRDSLALGLAPILDSELGQVIVRSSASAESMDCRGWLESVHCGATRDH